MLVTAMHGMYVEYLILMEGGLMGKSPHPSGSERGKTTCIHTLLIASNQAQVCKLIPALECLTRVFFFRFVQATSGFVRWIAFRN